MMRLEIVAYTVDDDIDSDVDRVVSELRGLLSPELVIVNKTPVTEERLEEILQQNDGDAL